MGVILASIEYLKSSEHYFEEIMEEREPQILADILISEEQTDQLGKALGLLIGHKLHRKVRAEYPLCTSLFLVWCTVYNYKEGNLWSPIFAKLGIRQSPKDREFLGELFLATISAHNLLSAPDAGKRYLTPIVMHGYISNHYAKRLLDYLNAVYISYLECNLSDSTIEKLWSELFNISEEQMNLRDRLEQLTEEENQLRNRSSEIEIPVILEGHHRKSIEQHQREAGVRQADFLESEQRLLDLDRQIEQMEILQGTFGTCQAAFTAMERPGTCTNEDTLDDICELGKQISTAFRAKLNELDAERKAARRELYTCKNSLAVSKDKSVVLMTAVVKLGGGDIEQGFANLDEHHAILNKLQEVIKQRQQLQTLLEHNHEFGNTSIPSILTTSLTSLGLADIRLFQEFIETTLLMLDALWKGQDLSEEHRMSQSLKSWHEDRERPTFAEAQREISTSAKLRDEVEPRRSTSNIRISRPRLQAPHLQYDEQRRQLVLMIPEQKLQIPQRLATQPEYCMDYDSDQEAVSTYCRSTPRNLSIGSITVPVKSADLRGLKFKLLSIFEYWHLALEPVMVFDSTGKLVADTQLRNGFFIMIVRNDWLAICDSVVDSYPLNVPNYTVFEVQLAESSITFRSRSGSEEDIVFRGSKHQGLSLEGVKLLPGVTQDGLPVGKGSPCLLLSRQLRGMSAEDIVFNLDYNGGTMHNSTLDKVIAQFGEEHTPEIIKLDLEKMAPVWRWRPNWETFEVELTDAQGEIVYQTAIAMVKGLSATYDSGRVVINVPSKSRLEHSEAISHGKAYLIPAVDSPIIDVRVFFDRIGWKPFSIEVPGGDCQLVSTDGEVLDLPLYLLKSEMHRLGDIMVRFQARSSLVRRVVVFDQEEDLSMTFHLSRHKSEIPLSAFVDVWRDLSGGSKIYLKWEGESGSTGLITLVEVHETLEVMQPEVYQSEQEDQYVLELSFVCNFPHLDRLRVRMSEVEDADIPILDRSVRRNPDYFYIRKQELRHNAITAELYYVEQYESVFGSETVEHVCWTHTLLLSNRKTRLKQAMTQGVTLTGFSYDNCRHPFPNKYYISDIQLSPKRFEGEELLRGVIHSTIGSQNVFFYLEAESNILPYLWDEDDDGVQYDLDHQQIFWEIRDTRNVMAPLDNLEFEFGKVIANES